MANKKKNAGRKSGARRKTSVRRRAGVRRSSRSLGIAGISKPKDMKNDVLDIVAMAAGTFAGVKLTGMLDKVVNKSDSKVMGYVSPAVVTVAGVMGSTMPNNRLVKSVSKGIAAGAAFKLVEKVTNKTGLLSGDDQPLMMPGIGDFGQGRLPELAWYSENPDAPVTTTGGDPQYHMGTPSEVLSGDDGEIIAV